MALFNNLITFSRGSNATVTGADGLIKWAPHNLLTNSEGFDAAGWVKTASTVTANAAVAPDGTTTADKLVENSLASSKYITQSVSITESTVYTFTAYLKASERSWCLLEFSNATFGSGYAWFNLATGAVGTTVGLTNASIVSAGNGWYRCSITKTSLTAGSGLVNVWVTNADNVTSYTGDGTSGIFVWGAQLEAGSIATAYNSTSPKNLLGFSEAFENAAWSKTASSIVPVAQANPVDKLFDAQKLMEDTTSGLHLFGASVTFLASPHTISIYAKAAERSWLQITIIGTTNAFANFNIGSGALGVVGAAATASIQSVGSGWYRCSITATPVAGAGTVRFCLASADNTINYAGNGNSGIYVWGAQASNSASLDPYVPTPGAAPASAAFYGPRFDYDPVTLAPRGLLVEEQRTNLLLRSEEFGTSWTPTRATVSSNVTISPDGTVDADKIVEDTSNNSHFISQVASSVTGSASVTISIYAKASGRNFLSFVTQDSAATFRTSYFNLSNGTLGTIATGHTASIQSVGNGWYRCAIVTTQGASTGNFTVYPGPANVNGSPSYTGDGTSGIFVWGAQLEIGAFATSYIPTVASTVTRSADSATLIGSNFSAWYNQPEGAFVVEWLNTNPGTAGRYIVRAISPTVTQGISTWLNSNGIDTRAWVGGTSITAGNATVNAPNKTAFGYRATDNAVSLRGLTPVTSNAVGPTNIISLEIGGSLSSPLNGHIRSIKYYPVRPSNTQLQELSK